MYILGLNAYHGDAAAAIVKDGELIAAVEEERFNRIKHSAGFPTESIRYCLAAAGIQIQNIQHIGISRNPSAHLHKKILFAASRAALSLSPSVNHNSRVADSMSGGTPSFARTAANNPRVADSLESSLRQNSIASGSVSDPSRLKGNGNSSRNNGGRNIFRYAADRLNNVAKIRDLRNELARKLGLDQNILTAQFHNIEHHRAHLASSFFVSPFERAALLSIDGFGDFISTMWARGEDQSIEVLGQVEYPHSLGIVYTATTQFLGFPHYGDEGKVMGLAPYGKPRYLDLFREIVRDHEGGQFTIDLNYFRHHSEGVDMSWDLGSPVIGRIYSDAYIEAFGPPRETGGPLTDRDRDIAASLQLRLEEVSFHILTHLHEETGLTELGLSGGVAYNSVMNGKILLKTPFRHVFVQPAAGDSGTAIGVCYQIYNDLLRQAQRWPGAYKSQVSLTSADRNVMESANTGPEYAAEQICAELNRSNLRYETCNDADLIERAARDIGAGLVVGWFQGRMEFGPRALGNRSILVDPRRSHMKQILNERIKKREPFRPFAPSILEEHTGAYFEQDHPAPTMLMVYQIREERRTEIPAVTHVDGSGRLQTVSPRTNPRYYQLLTEFHKLTGVPLLLNTSFNEDEPIVCTPRDAIECFLKTRIDVLYLGNYVVKGSYNSTEY